MKHIITPLSFSMFLSCGPVPENQAARLDERTATLRINRKIERPSAADFHVSIGAASTTGGGNLTYLSGNNVPLGEQLSNRTVLLGEIGSVSNPARVVGAVVDIPGQSTNGVCRPRRLDISSISASHILKPDAKIDATAQAQVWFSNIIDKQTSAEAGYLGFTANMNTQDRAEVIIQDVAIHSTDNFNNAVDPTLLREAQAPPLPAGHCGRYVITRSAITTIGYRILRTNEVRAGVTAIFNIGGRRYHSYEKISNDLRMSVQLQPLRHGVSQPSLPAPPVVPIAP